ncbi:FAD binding domain-containing protein [Nonomuraea sp. NPDC050451]|uniref:FAD binding domain-containing protein n=1 Tax=Nonomuraea sp. NPDC050451 TaxID=3364364 RepID=UPI0037AABB13
MKPALFTYRRPDSVGQALDWLRSDDAKVLAGGQSLLPMMNLRLARPRTLVDLGALGELERTFEDVDSVLVGALVRHRTIETAPVFARRVPLLAAAAAHIGHVAIRNRGTLGGTLAHADPSAELPLIAALLEATIYLDSYERGRREVPASEFFTGYFTTQMEPDEAITWIRVPARDPGEGWGFVEFARRHGDFALAGAAVTLRLDGAGRIAALRAGALAAGDVPQVLPEPAGLAGTQASPDVWAELAAMWSQALRPAHDQEYARALAAVALRRALAQAHGRALPQEEQ